MDSHGQLGSQWQQGELKKHYNLDVSPITTTAMWQIVAKVNEDLWRHTYLIVSALMEPSYTWVSWKVRLLVGSVGRAQDYRTNETPSIASHFSLSLLLYRACCFSSSGTVLLLNQSTVGSAIKSTCFWIPSKFDSEVIDQL